MTRQEFIDNIEDWYELIDFCADIDCDLCENIYESGDRDAYIDDRLVTIARESNSWSSLLDELGNIPTGYDYYELGDYSTEWSGLDGYDFRARKNEVLSWGDNRGIWDEEEPLIEDEDDDLIVDEELISIGELIGACNSRLHQINDDNNTQKAADDEAFEVFVAGCVTISEDSSSDYDFI